MADLELLRVFEPTASCIFDFRFGLYHVVIVLSFPRNISFAVICLQLFQLTLSDPNKAKRQDRSVLWDYFFL